MAAAAALPLCCVLQGCEDVLWWQQGVAAHVRQGAAGRGGGGAGAGDGKEEAKGWRKSPVLAFFVLLQSDVDFIHFM